LAGRRWRCAQNDRKTAIGLYKQVEEDGGLPQPYRDLAIGSPDHDRISTS
jgi:hypothetical protein